MRKFFDVFLQQLRMSDAVLRCMVHISDNGPLQNGNGIVMKDSDLDGSLVKQFF